MLRRNIHRFQQESHGAAKSYEVRTRKESPSETLLEETANEAPKEIIRERVEQALKDAKAAHMIRESIQRRAELRDPQSDVHKQARITDLRRQRVRLVREIESLQTGFLARIRNRGRIKELQQSLVTREESLRRLTGSSTHEVARMKLSSAANEANMRFVQKEQQERARMFPDSNETITEARQRAEEALSQLQSARSRSQKSFWRSKKNRAVFDYIDRALRRSGDQS